MKGAVVMNCKRLSSSIIISSLLICVLNPVQALTVVSGEVSGRWTMEGSPYIANGDITLPSGSALRIDPGVEVKFANDTYFNVLGTLTAIGTIQDSITFRANSGGVGDWRWFKFEGGASSASQLQYCIIQHTEQGLFFSRTQAFVANSRISDHQSACVRFEFSGAEVFRSLIANSERNGVRVDESSNARISNCTISNCEGNGISVGGGASPVIEYVLISGQINENGIFLFEAGACSLSYNRIYGCGIRAVTVFTSNNAVLLRNIAYRNAGDYAVYVYRSQNVNLINNTIHGNTVTGAAYVNSSGSMINNIVSGNGDYGLFVQGNNVELEYNDAWGNTRSNYFGIEAGRNDISEDPRFVNPGIYDFTPQEGSPVIDTGSPRYSDPDGTVADIGAIFFNQNHPPEITSFWPENLDTTAGDQEIEFGVEATDPDGDNLTYAWYVNSELRGAQSVFRHTFTVDGVYYVFVVVSDRLYMGDAMVDWAFTVEGSFVNENAPLQPAGFQITVPYPNPFNDSSRFSVVSMTGGELDVSVYNICGIKVAELWKGNILPGTRTFTVSSKLMPVGSYFLSAEQNGNRSLQKITVLK